jgi:LysR family hydrogen peroxide-inducible transcriptional activator
MLRLPHLVANRGNPTLTTYQERSAKRLTFRVWLRIDERRIIAAKLPTQIGLPAHRMRTQKDGLETMDINQITYFLNLADTLNFTEAARRSGVAQPSLTKSIGRLEEELGGSLLYRDGKDSRLTALGREIQIEFMRIESGLMNVRELAENSVRGRKRVLSLGVAPTIAPNAFSGFIQHVLTQLPSVELNVHTLVAGEGAEEVLSGKYDACILPKKPKENFKLSVLPLFCERYLLAFAEGHSFAKHVEIPAAEMAKETYVDRLSCEFHSQIIAHFMDRKILMYPRFSSDREEWVQQIVAAGNAVCIMPERSATVAGIDARPVEKMDLKREVVLVAVSGNGTPAELRQVLRMAANHKW